ncbi:MAG TPA: LptA/OstA family protein, partial [bacterium]
MRRPAAISLARSPVLVLAASALLALSPAAPVTASFMPDGTGQIASAPSAPQSPSAPLPSSAPGPAPLGPAAPEGPAPAPSPAALASGEAFTVTADRIEYNSLARTLRADGHVRASSGDAVITADHLDGSADTQEITATGHVTLSQGLTTATGSLLTYNLGTKVGRMENMTGLFGPLHVSGQAIEIAPGQDVVSEASVTPCDPDNPFYKITARKIVIVPDQSFTAYDASLWVGGVRVITLPSYTSGLRGRSGPS